MGVSCPTRGISAISRNAIFREVLTSCAQFDIAGWLVSATSHLVSAEWLLLVDFIPAGPSVVADKGKAPMPDLDIPAEFLAEDAQARQCLEEEQASERLVQRLRAEDLAQEDLQNVS
ncbi:hypothetical protein Tco_1027904, partial [Tanacetum coccineum]